MKINRKLIKILCVLFIVFVIILATYSVNADIDISGVEEPSEIKNIQIDNIFGVILGSINVIGATIAFVTLTVIGIKYMMGSSEEKSEYKSSMIPYVVGAVILFAAPRIITIIYNLAITIN